MVLRFIWFGLLLFGRLTNGFTGSALPYMDECDHTTVLSMMPFAIFYLLQPVMKIPYPLLNDMIWCLFACEVLGMAVTYIMQFLRINQFSACLEAPSWWTNDDYYCSEASKNPVFIQKRFLASALLPWCSVLALTQAVVCTLLLLGLNCSEGLAKTFHDGTQPSRASSNRPPAPKRPGSAPEGILSPAPKRPGSAPEGNLSLLPLTGRPLLLRSQPYGE